MGFSASKEERRPEDSTKSTVLSLYRLNLPKTQKTILRMTNIWEDISRCFPHGSPDSYQL